MLDGGGTRHRVHLHWPSDVDRTLARPPSAQGQSPSLTLPTTSEDGVTVQNDRDPLPRADPCLQSTPAAAPADQPQYPDSSRVVCHLRSGSMRTASHQDHWAGSPGVLAVNGTWNAALRCVPIRALTLLSAARGCSNNETRVCAKQENNCLPLLMPGSLFTQTCHSAVSSLREPGMPGKRQGCWTADAMQCVTWDASFSPQYGSEQALGSPVRFQR